MAEDMVILGKAKELAVHSYKITSNVEHFPKKYRHSLADRIQLKCMDIYDDLLEANRINNKTNKRERCEKITNAIKYCDELEFYIELAKSILGLKKISVEYWTKKVSDVKYMAIAWRTAEEKQK